MFAKIKKRDGRIVDFTKEKITGAIFKAARQVGGEDYETAESLTERVISYLYKRNKFDIPDVETIQDAVEKVLIEAGHAKTAKAYILYRSKRTRIRDAKSELMDVVKDILNENSRDSTNAGNSPSGKMLQIASVASKHYYLNNVIPEEMSRAHIAGDIHIHDLEYYSKTFSSLQIGLAELLSKGFDTGYGFVRPPRRISSAAAQAAIILRSNRNDIFGHQGYPHFDSSMGEVIRKQCPGTTDEEIFRSMEGFMCNAAQIPLSSMNLGTDTTREGRRITEAVLKSFDDGLGEGESPVFPHLVFRLKKGINMDPGDPNYDLFRLAMGVASKRMSPSFSFMDSSFNRPFGDEVSYTGCGLRVIENRHGAEISAGRGNVASVTINLPRIALKTKDIDVFFVELNSVLDLCSRQLLHRFDTIASLKTKELPFLMGQRLYYNSANLRDEDEIREPIKNGTLDIGFAGLAEALAVLTGKHHGEDEESRKIGYQIAEGIKKAADNYSEQHNMNFAVFAAPSGEISERFIEKDRKEFGLLKGVTDKEKYTDSFFIPSDCQTDIFQKIEEEAPFHKLCEGGHIISIELPAPPENLQDLEKILKYMTKCDAGHGAISFPVDRT